MGKTGVVLTYTNLATDESVSIKTSGSVTSAVPIDGVTHEHEIDLTRERARRNVSLWVEYGELERALNIVGGSSLLQHALTGLARNGLIEDHDWGPRTEAHLVNSPYDEVVVAVPSIAGFELYGWAQGRGDMLLERFPFEAEVFDNEPTTARLKTALLFESVMEIFRENERKQES